MRKFLKTKKGISARHNRSVITKASTAGITLIALVVTIVILLILTGVTIATLTGENGLLNRTTQASEKAKNSSAKEEIELAIMEERIRAETGENLENKFYYENVWTTLRKNDSNLEVTENTEDNNYTILYKGYYFKIDEKSNVTYIEKGGENPEETEKNKKVLSYKIKNTKNEGVEKLLALKDMSGNGNDAEIYNLDYTENKDGIIFNGTDGYAKINMQQEITYPITAEVMISATQKQNGILFVFNSNKMGIGIYGDYFIPTASGGIAYKIPQDFFDGNLKHLVIIYESAERFELYVNGSKLDSVSPPTYYYPGSVSYIGRRESGTYYKGNLYTLRIYNKVLDSTEIQTTYTSDKNHIENDVAQIQRSNLVLEYVIKNNEENSKKYVLSGLVDNSGNGNDAEIYNIDYTENKDGIVFNGINGYAKINMQQEITYPITAEVMISATQKQNGILFVFNSNKMGIGIYGDYFIPTASGGIAYNIPQDFFDGNLKHLVIVYESAEKFELYINGRKLDSVSAPDYYTPENGSYIGRRESGTYYKGILYELNIYNKKFSENEIKNNYEIIKNEY